MKRLALLSMISTPAFGHLVPYDSKAFLELAKGNPEKANYIAHFCSLAADSVDDCMSRLLVANGQIAAEKCGREINEIGEKLKEEMHLVGGFKGVPLSGYPHTKELCTKEEGCHRYGYTDGTREIAGRELGTTYVRQAREHAVKIQETDTNGKDVTGGVKGSLEGSAGLLGTEVKTALEGTAENTTSNEKATVKGGLTEFQIAKAYNAGFKKGWENPLKAGHYPDVFFIKGESEAVGADGKRYKNDPKFDLPPIPKDQLKDEGPASVSKPKENDKPTSGPLHPTSPTFSTPTPKQGASLDASDKLDGSWALIAPTQSGDLSPIQVCYEIEMTKIKKKEMGNNFYN